MLCFVLRNVSNLKYDYGNCGLQSTHMLPLIYSWHYEMNPISSLSRIYRNVHKYPGACSFTLHFFYNLFCLHVKNSLFFACCFFKSLQQPASHQVLWLFSDSPSSLYCFTLYCFLLPKTPSSGSFPSPSPSSSCSPAGPSSMPSYSSLYHFSLGKLMFP